MLRKKVLIVLFSFLLSSAYTFAKEKEKGEFLKIQAEKISNLSANHKQGSITFTIDGKYYFYYINSQNNTENILATSAIINDLRNAKKIDIKHIKYGLHRKIINLLIFFK